MRAVFLGALLAVVPPALAQEMAELSGVDIVEQAYQAAGGDEWVNPTSLYMEGYGLFWNNGPEPARYEPYRMWRVFPENKEEAHAADGRVRIEAFAGEQVIFQLSFDGTNTYNQNGLVDGEEADSNRWSSNFGFGVIRHALDEGYSVERLADDQVNGQAAYTVMIHDPAGGETLFNIRQEDYAVLRVGFDTPRGWHERIYSNFYRNEEGGWQQPGLVRLYYNGVKANEIYWTSFEIGEEYPDELFQLAGE